MNIESLNSLRNNLLLSISNPSSDKIILELQTQDDQVINHFNLNISNVIKVYYQRFESSIQREGFRNLNRLKLTSDNSEWVNHLTSWQSPFSKETGFELLLYNGSILRFVGEDLILEKETLEDISEIQNQQAVPDHIEQTAAKIISKTSFPKLLDSDTDEDKTGIIEQEDISYHEISVEEINIEDNEIEENKKLPIQAELEDSSDITDQSVPDEISTIQEMSISDQSGEDEEIIFTDENKTSVKEIGFEKSVQETVEILQIHELDEFEKDDSSDELITTSEIDSKLDDSTAKESPIEEEKIDITDQFEVVPQNLEKKPTDLLAQIEKEENNKASDTDVSIEEEIDVKSVESKILTVNGVTTQNMESLISIGYDTIEKLASLKISQLIKINGIGKATARKIIESANILTSTNA